jgi:hypothetical protein
MCPPSRAICGHRGVLAHLRMWCGHTCRHLTLPLPEGGEVTGPLTSTVRPLRPDLPIVLGTESPGSVTAGDFEIIRAVPLTLHDDTEAARQYWAARHAAQRRRESWK